MEENKGDLSLFNELVGNTQPTPQQRPQTIAQPPKQVYPWGTQWLDIRNDILFTDEWEGD
jgi:hypothetical protein